MTARNGPPPKISANLPQAAAGSQQLRLLADAEVKPPGPGQKLQHLLRQMMNIHRHLQEAGIFQPRQQQSQQGPVQDGDQGLGH